MDLLIGMDTPLITEFSKCIVHLIDVEYASDELE